MAERSTAAIGLRYVSLCDVFLETEVREDDLAESTEGEGEAERGVETSEVSVLYGQEAGAEAICRVPVRRRCDADTTRDSGECRWMAAGEGR